jgi:thiol-disulfide isomerase/thioredoxin
MTMHTRLLSLLALMLFAFPATTALAQQATAPEAEPEVLAVRMYADWCGNCKILDAQLAPLLGELEARPIRFLKFDMTNDETKASTAAAAEELGLGELYAKYAGRTGLLVLVDARTHEELQVLTRSETTETLRAAITARLK